MILALAIICCVVATLAVFAGLLAYACTRASTKPYPRKPENKDQT